MIEADVNDKEFYWVLPIDSEEWEIAQAKKTRRMGYRPNTFEFLCSDGGFYSFDDFKDIRHIERPT